MNDEENIITMNNINSYSILISTKGSLAVVVLDESNFSVGFEKTRFDAPEIKMGFLIFVLIR
jgi:hypothetical protein